MPRLAPLLCLVLLTVGVLTAGAVAQSYSQPTPDEQWVGGKPTPSYPEPRGQAERYLDIAVFLAVLAVGAWAVLKRRRRGWILAVLVAALLYLGFWRQGCVCPIGAIQNGARSLVDPAYTISIVVTLILLLPLAAALLGGRVFCGTACPLGAVQDLMLVRPLRVPRWLDRTLRVVPWLYLGTALFFAVGGLAAIGLAVKPDFLICRYDPFINIFRSVDLRAATRGDWGQVFSLAGVGWIWAFTGGIVVLGLFVGRPYCRWLCPYGVLLGSCARAARKPVSVSPTDCIECGLCDEACPFGAIENHRAVAQHCVACGRCYEACPLERERRGQKAPAGRQAPPAPPLEAPPPPTRVPAPLPALAAESDPVELGYLDELLARHESDRSAALVLLQAVQARHRYLPRPALEALSERLGLPLAELLSLCTFYNVFRLQPVGEHLVSVCHGTACHVAGAGRITDALRRHLDLPGDADTDAARRFTVQRVACLGCCSLAPVMQIDGVTFGHLSPDSAVAALERAGAGGLAGGEGHSELVGRKACACDADAHPAEARP